MGCRTIVLVVLVGLRCLSGRSQWTRKSPGDVSYRSLRVLASRVTRNRGDDWASLRSPCGLPQCLPAEGRRSFSWKPRTPSEHCASWSVSSTHREPLSTLGLVGGRTNSSVATSCNCRAQEEASFFSPGGRRRPKENRKQGRTLGPESRFVESGARQVEREREAAGEGYEVSATYRGREQLLGGTNVRLPCAGACVLATRDQTLGAEVLGRRERTRAPRGLPNPDRKRHRAIQSRLRLWASRMRTLSQLGQRTMVPNPLTS
jgi:hypothetical protein